MGGRRGQSTALSLWAVFLAGKGIPQGSCRYFLVNKDFDRVYTSLHIYRWRWEWRVGGWDVYFGLGECVHIEWMNPRCASGYTNVKREADRT